MENKLMPLFRDNMDDETTRIAHGETLEALVGIPFFNELDTLPDVVRTARLGIAQSGQSGKAAIVLVGPRSGAAVLAQMLALTSEDEATAPVTGFLLDQRLVGRGWSILALMEVATRAGAKLALLLPDLIPQEGGGDMLGKGFSPHWVSRLFGALDRTEIDLALARFNRHPLALPVESLLAFPIISGVFGYRLRQPMPGVMALSSRLMHVCIEAARQWPSECGMYGFDAWLTTRAVMEGSTIAEVHLGLASFRHDVGKLKIIFRQTAGALLTEVYRNRQTWMNRPAAIRQPVILGPIPDEIPDELMVHEENLLQRFKHEFDHFDHTLFQHIVPDELRTEMERWSDGLSDRIGISQQQWTDVLERFIIAFSFSDHAHPYDIIDGLFPLFLAQFLQVIDRYRAMLLSRALPDENVHMHLAERLLQCQGDAFINAFPQFRESWRDRQSERSSYLPRLGAWEFIPDVDIIVPQELKRKNQPSVWACRVYQEILDDRRATFIHFMKEHLEVHDLSHSQEVLSGIRDHMVRLESAAQRLFPYGLDTPDNAFRMTDETIRAFSKGPTFQLTPAAARHLLLKAPPCNLLMLLGNISIGRLLDRFEANDLLAMAAWTDRQHSMDRVLDILLKEADPTWFHTADLKPTSLDIRFLNTFDDVRGEASLLRLAGRIVAASHLQAEICAYPTLWFLLKTIKSIVGFEMFSRLWGQLAREKRDFAKQLVSSIKGHWGRRVLSAHHIFQNHQQREVVKRLYDYVETLRRDPDKTAPAAVLAAAADVYHVAITLPDNTFIPLSAWTWASYSSRGGAGWPTPLSSLVERDWASRDFLVKYLDESGRGDAATVERAIFDLMRQGRESEDLGSRLLRVADDSENIVALQTTHEAPAPAGKLIRPVVGPILEPVPEHPWESRYVLNAAAVRLEGIVYIVYRAFGGDHVSRLGLAWTRDGIHIDGRLDAPIFSPMTTSEVAGCEDPRITLIGDRLYMLYTAYDGRTPQIAMASISSDAFLNRRFDEWTRHGLGFPGVPNKDATLYPEKLQGQYAIYHRIDPAMWVSYTDDLRCPWPNTGHKIVIGPRSGMMWDGIKIGAGAQPIKTERGWLNIYHGVDYERTYRLGILLMDLNDPSRVIYQSPNPILEPEVDFELGKTGGGDFWVPRVVFTCGAVLSEETKTATMDDEVLVYYGAADTAIGVAKARIGDLLPM